MRYLTFALGKGRLAKQTLELFEKIGITCEEMKDKDSRKLIFTNEELKLRFFLAKGPDVPRSGYRSRWKRYNPGRRT
jgi:ATP phosphoribosyltransferase